MNIGTVWFCGALLICSLSCAIMSRLGHTVGRFTEMDPKIVNFFKDSPEQPTMSLKSYTKPLPKYPFKMPSITRETSEEQKERKIRQMIKRALDSYQERSDTDSTTDEDAMGDSIQEVDTDFEGGILNRILYPARHLQPNRPVASIDPVVSVPDDRNISPLTVGTTGSSDVSDITSTTEAKKSVSTVTATTIESNRGTTRSPDPVVFENQHPNTIFRRETEDDYDQRIASSATTDKADDSSEDGGSLHLKTRPQSQSRVKALILQFNEIDVKIDYKSADGKARVEELKRLKSGKHFHRTYYHKTGMPVPPSDALVESKETN